MSDCDETGDKPVMPNAERDSSVEDAVASTSSGSPSGTRGSWSAEQSPEPDGLQQPDGSLIPVPPPTPKNGVSILAHKIWIGNLDKRLTEQNILQFVTKYGSIVSFKFLFRSGAERSEQRDYCFVEYSTREEAEKAKAALDKKKVLGKRIIVDWAKTDLGAVKKNPNAVSETWDASSVSETLDGGVSTSAKIAALEAKLRQMEEEDMGETGGVATKKPKLSSNRPTTQTNRHTSAGSRSTGNTQRRPKSTHRTRIAHIL